MEKKIFFFILCAISTTFSQILQPPNLLSPTSGQLFTNPPTFSWSSVFGNSGYRFGISTSSSMSEPLIIARTLTGISITPGSAEWNSLNVGQTYYWSVRTFSSGGQVGNWASSRSISRQGQTVSFGGTITDASTGSAISGVSVSWGSYSTTTGSSGNYSFNNVPCQTATLTVSKIGYQTSSQNYSPTCNTSSIKNVSLTSNLTSFGGIVTDASKSNAISGVSVSWGSYSTTTSSNGNYSFNNMPCQTATLTISRSGYLTYSQSYMPTCNASNVKNVSLTPNLTTSFGGIITDASTGSAISGASVSWGSYSTTTGSSGNYSFNNVPCQTATLTVSKIGYQSSSQNYSPTCNTSSIKNVSLTSNLTSFGGIVTDASTGNVISGVSVSWGSYSTTTSSNGNYSFNSVSCQTATLTFSKSGYQAYSQSYTPTCNASNVKNVSLSMNVTSFGGIVTDASTGNVISGASVSWGSYNTTTNSNGNYSFNSVPCQTATLAVSKSGYQTYSQGYTPICNTSNLKNIGLSPNPTQSIKIIGIIQNTHNNPSVPIGITIIAKVPTSNTITECKFYWDNLDDASICIEGSPQDLSSIGSNFFKIIVTEAFPWICGFSSGNEIRWRIQAKDDQNKYYYYPEYQSPILYDTTAVYSYAQLNNNIQIGNGVSGFVVSDVINTNSISVKNNKAVWLSISQEPESFTLSGDVIKLFSTDLLYPKSLPFGFFEPPTIEFSGLNSQENDKEIKITFSKIGKKNSFPIAYTLTTIDLILNILELGDDRDIKIALIKFFYQLTLEVMPNLDQKKPVSTEEYTQLTADILFAYADYIVKHNTNLFVKLIEWGGMNSDIALKLSLKLAKKFTPISTVSTAISFVNTGISLYDLVDNLDNDDVVIVKKSHGHFIEITPLNLAGVMGVNPLPLNANTNFTFSIKNTSNQKLYNLWLGLDIWAWDYAQNKYIKIESTKTSYTDLETQKIGLLDFRSSQGQDLKPGESMILISNNYAFTSSVTGHQYHSTNIPYKYVYTAWSNGEPGQTSPVTASNLSKDLISVPFYIKDNIAPNPPTLSIILDLETDSTAYFYWQKNINDIDIVKYIISANGTNIDTVDELVCRSMMIEKQNTQQIIRVKAIDVGGNESEWSNTLIVPTLVNKVVKPVISPAYQTFPPSFNVTISCETEGAIIRYTTNGSEPTISSSIYSGPLSISYPSYSTNVTLRAKAWKDGYDPSDTSTANYIYLPADTVSTPLINPNTGNFPPSKDVTISCATEDAIIRYTLDGSEPTTLSPQYIGTITISSPPYKSNVILKAKAWKEPLIPSDIAVGNYTYSYNKVATPIIEPTNRMFPPVITVSITCPTEGAIIYYTLNGREPTEGSTVYSQPISINANDYKSTVILKAKAWKDGYEPSEISEGYYVYNGVNQQIEIGNKWNLISLNVTPPNTNMRSIVQPLIDSGSLVKVQDENGNAIENILENWINNIGNWSPTEGYYLKANKLFILSVSGISIDLPFNIPLENKWNIISYPLNSERNSLACLQTLIDADALIKVQDEDGNAVEKILGTWINNIGNFKPGKAYYLRASKGINLNFEPFQNPSLNKEASYRNESTIFNHSVRNSYLPMNIYIQWGSKEIITNPKAVINIYDGDVLCSSVKLCEGIIINNFFVIQAITNMDDPSTKDVDGFVPGNNIKFRLKDNNGEKELIAKVVENLGSNASLIYKPLGTVVVKLANGFYESGNNPSQEIQLFNNYPNPFNPSTQISYLLPKDDYITLTIFDVNSRKVKTLYDGYETAGYHSRQWDGNNDDGVAVTSAVYFYQLKTNKSLQTKKLLLLK